MKDNGHYSQDITRCFICCYDYPNKTYVRKLKHYEVPEPVYAYICQLEQEINHSTGSVQKLYDFRFNENPQSMEDVTKQILNV